jgi:hypothetical protein
VNSWIVKDKNTLNQMYSIATATTSSLLQVGASHTHTRAIFEAYVDSFAAKSWGYYRLKDLCGQSESIKNDALSMLLASSFLLDQVLIDRIINKLIKEDRVYTHTMLAELLLLLSERVKTDKLAQYDKLRKYTIEGLKFEVDQGLKAANDWSLDKKLPCSCEDCEKANLFITSSAESKLIWPLAELRRKHISSGIDNELLPITCYVIKKGSPYKLELQKNLKLNELREERFNKVNEFLCALKRIYKSI